MKNFYVVSIICLLSAAKLSAESLETGSIPEFVILITSYNNEKYAKDNLKSVCHQKSSKPYRVICINDCSKDKTAEIMDTYVNKHNLTSRVTLIHNKQRVGALENIYNAIYNYIPDNAVVVSVDGDDMLLHNEVLLQLEKAYSNPDIWMTYGSCLKIPEGTTTLTRRIPEFVFEQKKLREYDFVAQHLRTFKAGLFKKIKKADLMYEEKFFTMTWDMAFMFPMLEMCSPQKPGDNNHSKHIKEILYLYRVDNPINDIKVNRTLQKRLKAHIRAMPPYEPINNV